MDIIFLSNLRLGIEDCLLNGIKKLLTGKLLIGKIHHFEIYAVIDFLFLEYVIFSLYNYNVSKKYILIFISISLQNECEINSSSLKEGSISYESKCTDIDNKLPWSTVAICGTIFNQSLRQRKTCHKAIDQFGNR